MGMVWGMMKMTAVTAKKGVHVLILTMLMFMLKKDRTRMDG